MSKEFKVGDKIYNKSCNLYGFITDFMDDRTIKVKFPDADVFSVWYLDDCEVVKGNKAAFLTGLGALLRKYDAKIGYVIGTDKEDCWAEYYHIKIGCNGLTNDDIVSITADNVMDFKE